MRYYNLHADKLKDVDNLLLSDLKEVEHVLAVKSPETISTSPEAILYDALRKQLVSRARRIPLVSYDSESQRTMVVSVITQYRILKFIAMNVNETDKLRKPLGMIKLGTYERVFRCSMEATVLDVIDEMVTRNISSVPVCTTDGKACPFSFTTTILTCHRRPPQRLRSSRRHRTPQVRRLQQPELVSRSSPSTAQSRPPRRIYMQSGRWPGYDI